MTVLSDHQFLVEMEKKLIEEVDEYMRDKTMDELIDILDVVYRIAQLRGTKRSGLEQLRRNKQKTKGAFNANIFLVCSNELD